MTAATIVPTSDRADWLAKRRTGIGASDIAAIMGVSPWSTPLQVWVSKVSDDAPETDMSEDMLWGARMEALILDEFEQRQHDLPLYNRGALWRNEERPFMLATPDAVTDHRMLGQMPVEAKKVDAWNWDDGIPDYYQMQVQWQMAVLGAPRGFLVALHRGRRLEIYPLEADPELQAAMITAAEGFWGMVEQEIPPPAQGEDSAFLNSLYPTHIEEAVEVAPEIASELRLAKDTMNQAKSRLAAAEAALKEIMGEADTAVVGQDVVATWRTQTTRRFDLKRFKAEDPDTVELFTKPSSSRVLRVKAAKDDQ